MTTYLALTVRNPKHSNCKGGKLYKVVQVGFGIYDVVSRTYGLSIDLRDIDFIEAI
jgi:hypothetical protein